MAEFARIRKRLLAINKRADNNSLSKRRKAVDTKHIDLRDLPVRFKDEKWCREARARFLPSLLFGAPRSDSWIRLEIEQMCIRDSSNSIRRPWTKPFMWQKPHQSATGNVSRSRAL